MIQNLSDLKKRIEETEKSDLLGLSILNQYKRFLESDIDIDKQLVDLDSIDSPELKEYIEEEKLKLKENKQSNYQTFLNNVKNIYLEDDFQNCIIELRAGAGGNEASLFANDLYSMYTNYCNIKRIKYEPLFTSYSPADGFKEVGFKVYGGYYSFKYEGGVHRVQRVPVTENMGRIHTSTVSVAILPEISDTDYKISDNDLKIETFKASGPGGQKVNKIESAVRITHIPTGLTASCQDSKSQHMNKANALELIRSRVWSYYKSKEEKQIQSLRTAQIGQSMRAEKIRTYNFPQDRVTDHRINKSFSNIFKIVDGNNFEDISRSLHEFYDLQILD